MAITKCPECGGKISTEVQQCIHCGCPITVCPECGMTYKLRMDTCSECGYSFIKTDTIASAQVTENTEATHQTSTNVIEEKPQSVEPSAELANHVHTQTKTKPSVTIPTTTEIVEQWKKEESPFLYYVLNILGIINGVEAILTGIPGFICLLLMMLPLPSIRQFFFIAGIIALAVFFITLHLSIILFTLAEAVVTQGLWKWSQKKNIDLLPIIKHSLFINADKMKFFEARKYYRCLNFVLYSQCFHTSSVTKTREIVAEIVKFVMVAIESILIVIFSLLNVSVITSTPFKFSSYSCIFLVIIAVIMYGVGEFVFKRIEKSTEASVDNWVKKTFSDEAYVKYMANVK